MTPEQLAAFRNLLHPDNAVCEDPETMRAAACDLLAEVEQLTEHSTTLNELGTTFIALDVAQAALHRIHDRADMPPSIRTITEHALRAERWDDSVPPGGWVCAVCGLPCESEPCPDHGHTGAPWCCDTCKTSAEAG